MITNVLVAVDDSPGGLAAAALAVELSGSAKAHLHVLAVTDDGFVAEVMAVSGGLRPASADAVLRHVVELARRAGVPAQTYRCAGEVAKTVLAQTKSCRADLIVMGRTRDSHNGQAVIGSQTSLVLEFTAVPVLVVPPC